MSAPRPLNDAIAEAIRADGDGLREQPWSELSEGRKVGWLQDADRVISCLRRELADVVRLVLAAQAFVDDLSIDDAGERYVTDIHNGTALENLVAAAINCTEAAPARLLQALSKAPPAAPSPSIE